MMKQKSGMYSTNKSFTILCLFFACLLTLMGCSNTGEAGSEYYTLDDYRSVPKFNSHVHLHGDNRAYIDQSVEDNFKLLSFISSSPNRTREISIIDQEKHTLKLMEFYPEDLFLTTTLLNPYRFNEDGWVEEAKAHMAQSFRNGAVAIKFRKSIGMEVRKPNGDFVTIDDPKFDPIIQFIAENDITLIGHIGEPLNCWLPLEEMTVGGDRQYYSENPQYHMYLHPEYLSHGDHIRAVENMLVKHPNVRYVGAHLASLEYDVDELAKRLDRFPNLAVDMAERISHFQYQAVTDWEKVRDFFIRYQDRLIYATDDSNYGPKPYFGAELTDQTLRTDKQIRDATTENYHRHWKFFTYDGMMTAPKLPGMEFRALNLPQEVVDKIYLENAKAWFPGIL